MNVLFLNRKSSINIPNPSEIAQIKPRICLKVQSRTNFLYCTTGLIPLLYLSIVIHYARYSQYLVCKHGLYMVKPYYEAYTGDVHR